MAGGKVRGAPRLSVCIIAKDEEANLRRAIESVRGVAFEVIVLDTGSTDRTVEIARELGARVELTRWEGDFSRARNQAIALATGDWILSLDADEAATEAFCSRWAKVAARTPADGLLLPLTNVGEVGERAAFRLLRLFRGGRGYAYRGKIHEEVGSSIVRAGKAIAAADLPLVHYGYTREEDARKQRRARNRALLGADHEADPSNPRTWHYLALEHVSVDDHEAARPLLERMLTERPGDELAGWSASLLSDIYRKHGDAARAGSVARDGVASASGKVMCLMGLGALALEEGDPATCDWCADELLAVEGADLDAERRRPTALHLRAGARWERGERDEALADWLRAVLEHPSDGFLADQYVRHVERRRGGVVGALEAMRAASNIVVASAAVGSFVRAGDWGRARDLAARCPAQTLYSAVAFLRAGRVDDGLAILARQGKEGAVAALLWGLEHRDAPLVDRSLDGAPQAWRDVAESVQRGVAVPPPLEWLARKWARTSFGLRADAVAARLLGAASDPVVARGGLCAEYLLTADRPADAAHFALQFRDSPGGSEVLGLLAYAEGDLGTAAEWLTRRVAAGNAPVRVYRLAADALTRTGRPEDARRVRADGEAARPWSLAWRSAPPP